MNAGQLTLDLPIGGAQNAARGPAPQPACPDSGESSAVSAPKPAERPSHRRAPGTALAAWAAAQGLSGPRVWRAATAVREPLDRPEHAGAPARCRCERALPQQDELGVHCVKCGRRP